MFAIRQVFIIKTWHFICSKVITLALILASVGYQSVRPRDSARYCRIAALSAMTKGGSSPLEVSARQGTRPVFYRLGLGLGSGLGLGLRLGYGQCRSRVF